MQVKSNLDYMARV